MDPAPHPRTHSEAGWRPLADAVGQPARFGAKAARLAALRGGGLPVLDGWVLEVDLVARLRHDRDLRTHMVRALLELGHHDWILRSSSPLEDRRAATAAGLFRSGHAAPTPEGVATTLDEVVGSAENPALRELLAVDAAPLAVLAQPHRRFDLWLTVEVDRTSGRLSLRSEGWRWSSGTLEMLRATQEEPDEPELRALYDLARRAASFSQESRHLLELAADDQGPWLLQMRSAPGAPSPAAPSSTAVEIQSSGIPLAGLGVPVHAGDAETEWEWDREHCPRPLCPLLAGLFGRWLAASPASYPSRLIEGRWHDRVEPRAAPLSDADEVRTRLARWRQETMPALEVRAHALARAAVQLSGRPEEWNEFTADWLAFQSDYFARRPGGARRWARAVAEQLEAEGQALPPLGETLARRREHEWELLAARIELVTPAPARSAAALANWVDAHAEHDLAGELRMALEDCAHLAAMPYDGRGRTWGEDSTPFWRELDRRRRETLGALVDASEVRPRDDATEPMLAACVLTEAEDDNDLLLRVYAAFRVAVQRLGGHAIPDRPWEDLLDLLPDDLEILLAGPGEGTGFERSLARGRAVRARWETLPGAEGGLPVLRGRAAAAGRARGPVWRGRSLEELPDLDEAPIAVVATITPLDAVYFRRLAGLVCEGGDVLGHASVLAREHGLPCVVGVADARRQLAGAKRILVDGDAARIDVLE